MKKYIYFISITDAIFNNLLESEIKISDALEHGDFGIGTLNSLEGEMVILDKEVFTAKGDGLLYKVSPTCKTPMTMITTFKEDYSFIVQNINFKELQKLIVENLTNKNLLYAIKVECTISNIELRCIDKQPKPFAAFKELLENSKSYNYTDIKGTLVGFKLPPYLERINLSGFHFHFVDEDRKIGGHVYDCLFETAKVEISIHDSFLVELNNHEDFANVDFENKIDVKKLLDSEFKSY